MYTEVEFIPAEWVERSCWAAARGEQLAVYSRRVQVERRWHDIPVILDRRTDMGASCDMVESLLRALCGPKT